MIKLDYETISRYLRLDHETGHLYWKPRSFSDFGRDADCLTWNAKNAGNRTGCPKGNGYLVVRFQGKNIHAHRLVYLLTYGEDPSPLSIDHKNGLRSDNRPFNLRVVTTSLNNRNRNFLSPRNTSGFRGVYWHSAANKWAASVTTNYMKEHIGLFDNINDAAKAAETLRKKRHGN